MGPAQLHTSSNIREGGWAVSSHLTGSVRVQDFVFDDKPLPLPLLLVALGLEQVAAHRRVRVRRHLRDEWRDPFHDMPGHCGPITEQLL